MKGNTARVLRGVLRLIEDDVRELTDAVVQIDEREAKHYGERRALEQHVKHLEMRLDAVALLARDTGKRTTNLERRLLP